MIAAGGRIPSIPNMTMQNMRIAYLYNEKLPKKTAHDVYVWRNVYFLSQGLENFQPHVTYLTGPSDPCCDLETLQRHYLPKEHHFKPASKTAICEKSLPFWSTFSDLGKSRSHQIGQFEWVQLPLMRKSGPFRISWNLPFFYRCQKWIESKTPDWVLMSVYKQAQFHLKRKVAGVRYLFEVHDLAFYPQQDLLPSQDTLKSIEKQTQVLSQVDAITVTTEALKQTLEKAPYNIQKPIYVVPLASEMDPLMTSPLHNTEVVLGYVGQLYPQQGVDELIKAMAQVNGIRLEIMGGNTRDLERLKNLIHTLKLDSRVHLHGFVSPHALASRIYGCHALAAPFHPTSHMRHVAHTKLVDYGRWALPVVAPDLPITREEVRSPHFLFDATHYPSSLQGLIETLQKLTLSKERAVAKAQIDKNLEENPSRFSWTQRTQKLKAALVASDKS